MTWNFFFFLDVNTFRKCDIYWIYFLSFRQIEIEISSLYSLFFIKYKGVKADLSMIVIDWILFRKETFVESLIFICNNKRNLWQFATPLFLL